MSELDLNQIAELASNLRAVSDETYSAAVAVADVYNTTSSYDIGDYCIKSTLLYKCNTAIPSGEVWNSNHWDEICVSDELNEIRNSVIHVGASAPSNPNVQLWLDTDEPGMSGVSSVNGATGTVVLDLADIGFAELIWENANKVTDGTFAAQTITVDTSAYSYLLVVFCMHSHWPTSLATQIIKNGTVSYIFAQTWGGEIQPGQALQTYTRKVDASSTSGITFGTAYYGTSSTAGTLNVPYYIYGIKG